MEFLHGFLWLILSIVVLKLLLTKRKNLPPSPPALPILGHLHLLKDAPLHRTLQTLSNKYGPMLRLRFGTRPVVVVSSPSIAEQCFTHHDVVLANRPKTVVTTLLGYNSSILGYSAYGDHWRNLRRITTVNIFCGTSLNLYSSSRTEEVHLITQILFQSSNGGFRKVNLNTLVVDLLFNVITRMLVGRRWSGSRDMFKTLGTVMLMNSCDYLPLLRWVGYKGLEKKLINLQSKRNDYFQELIDEIRQKKYSKGERKTVIEPLLYLQEAEPEFYTDDILKGIVMVMYTAGAETSARSIEFAMSLMLNYPETLEKARKEIDNIVKDRFIEESDLPKLSYLRCVINETLRLFPVTPLLLPHCSSEDCTIAGFTVPRGTTVLVNAWAIHRDPKVWEEPTKFKPERFEEIEAGKEGFRFIPFGGGRRVCPGANMALRTIGLTLGTFIQCFDWRRVGPELEDLEEGGGLTVPKVKPLEALYRPRSSMASLLSQP
uniref:Cytochrome P450 n=1 Tax=Nothapodytes nimmoniana TaxID=159386 RepID=A0A7L7RB78_NOTNI|nr:cytochrome P450 [Nothapodytes nimmoniana]